MSKAQLYLYIADGGVMLFAIGCAASTFYERSRAVVKRFRLVLPGLFSFLGTFVLIAYPQPQDLFQVEIWMVAALSLLVGLARGAMLPMFSDHKWNMIQLRRINDGIAFGLAFVLFAAIQVGIELRAGVENHFEPTMEFVMTVVAGFLLGRSISSWLRAGMIQHDDLYEPIL